MGVGVGGEDDGVVALFSGDHGLYVAGLVDGDVFEEQFAESFGEKADAIGLPAGAGGDFAEHEGVGEERFAIGGELITDLGGAQ